MSVVGLLLGTGPVVQAVIVILVAFSIGSWGIIIHKLVQTSRAQRESDRFTTIFWESKNLASINNASIGLVHSPVAQVFRAGYQELLQLTRAKRQVVGGGQVAELVVASDGHGDTGCMEVVGDAVATADQHGRGGVGR